MKTTKKKKPRKTPKEKVFWTQEETALFADRVVELRKEDLTRDFFPICQEAQLVLPENRRKVMSGMINVNKACRKAINDRLAKIRFVDEDESSEEEPKITLEEVQELRSKIDSLNLEIQNLQGTIEDYETVLDSFDPLRTAKKELSDGDIIGIFYDRVLSSKGSLVPIIKRLLENFQKIEELTKQKDDVPLINRNEVTEHLQASVDDEPKVRLPRILVIGLKPSQRRYVEEKAASCNVDIRFEESDKSIKDVPPSIDKILVNRHSSHMWWDKAKSFDKKVSFCSGISSIVNEIKEHCNNNNSTIAETVR